MGSHAGVSQSSLSDSITVGGGFQASINTFFGRRMKNWSLPKVDPYSEIYLRRDRWWGLLRERWLQPNGGVPISWNDFRVNLSEAHDFHGSIQSAYHPNTYVYYGADGNVPSFETVSWSMKRGLLPDAKRRLQSSKFAT